MNFTQTIKNVFLKIAHRLGLELQDKSYMSDDRYSRKGFNPTLIGSDVVSTIAIDDSDIVVKGAGRRADAMREQTEYYSDDIRFSACSVSLGTGDVLIRPYTDGYDIGYSVISNKDFAIVDSIGNKIKSCIIRLDSYKKKSDTYDLFEAQTLKTMDTVSGEKTKVVVIRRFAYKNANDEISLSSTNWNEMTEEDIIPAEQLLFGRIKCPTINRDNPNSIEGVPITFGCETIEQNIINRYNQYNSEFDAKKVKIFANRTMFRTASETENRESVRIVPDGMHNVFELVKGVGDEKTKVSDMIDTYSPDIRDESISAGANFNLSILELCCGFSRGIFTAPETAFASATEMKNSLKKTFSFVKKFRGRIKTGEKQLFNAVNVLMNCNNITPMGDYELEFNWSYDYIEETKERFNQLMQMRADGEVSRAEVRSWGMNESLDDAQKAVSEIEQEDLSDDRTEKLGNDGIEG